MTTPTPAISRVLPDQTLIELLHDPEEATTSFAVRWPDGQTSVETSIDLPSGERLVPYSAANNLIASGCVRLPSALGDFRDVGDFRDLLEAIRGFLRRYVDLSPLFEDLAPYYVLLTWVHDAFNELPYLRFRGDYGTGKTRALLVVGSVCYKPFFASGASTVSPIFHVLDAFGGTLILDEADFRFSDATAELTKILNNGNMKGMPVLRTMTNRHRELNPTAFKVFGPKIIGMRRSFADKALESRFFTEETGGRPLRSDIPIHIPDSMETEARELRNQLLSWRFTMRFRVGPDTSRLIEGVEPRLNQTALALLSLVDDDDLRSRIEAQLLGVEAMMKDERSVSEEGAVLAAMVEAAANEPARNISLSEISQMLLRTTAEAFELPITNKRVGFIVRTRLRIATMKSNGVYVIPASERPKIATLAKRFGIDAAA